MELISRIAKLPYGGKVYGLGERFEANDMFARILILSQVAEAATGPAGYVRSDLQAQSRSGVEPAEQEYARRDMEPAVVVKRKRGRPRKVRSDNA
jgi:hypothetical protein